MQQVISLILAISIGYIPFAQSTVCVNSNFVFPIPAKENNCMSLFTRNTTGVNEINSFLLAKMSEMSYLERLDYQLRFLQNNRQEVSSIPSSASIKNNPRVTNSNFECAFAARFSHYFFDESKRPKRPVIGSGTPYAGTISPKQEIKKPSIGQPKLLKPESQPEPKNLPTFEEDSLKWVKENVPVVKFIRKSANIKVLNTRIGFDPELIIVSSKDLIIIVFRGTDNMNSFRAEDFDPGEWIGTNANFFQTPAAGNLQGTKIHQGFLTCYTLIRNELISFLNQQNARDKNVWITGHSLGGAMATIAGVDLKGSGFPVRGVYTYAAPRVIGDDKFRDKANQLLSNRIQRFEYYLDPIALIWVPSFEPTGRRNWYDHKNHGDYRLYIHIDERFVSLNPCDFNLCPFDDRTENFVRAYKARMSGLITDFGLEPTQSKFSYHNPQWYVKAAHEQLSTAERASLPNIDDSWPYLYDDFGGPMPGTK